VGGPRAGPVCARLLAEYLRTGVTTLPITPFSPERFPS